MNACHVLNADSPRASVVCCMFRYAPPQQYVMSRQTATPPPKPVAALLSPILWQMEHPDKFDMYSMGIMLLQMAFPNLRSDNSLIAFNRRLQELGWDLKVCGLQAHQQCV